MDTPTYLLTPDGRVITKTGLTGQLSQPVIDSFVREGYKVCDKDGNLPGAKAKQPKE